MNRKLLIGLIVVLSLCLCVTIVGVSGLIFSRTLMPPPSAVAIVTPAVLPPTATTVPPTRGAQSSSSSSSSSSRATVTPGVLPILTVTPPAPLSNMTADALARTIIPPRNIYQIVPRLKKNLALLTPIPTVPPRTRQVGDRDTFFVVEDDATGRYRTVTATLKIVTPNAYFWVDDGIKVDAVALQQSANIWEQKVYPTNTKYFGTPGRGLDGDARIHVLNTDLTEGTAGYFSSVDTFARTFMPYSNERNIIYMDAKAVPPGKDEYEGDLAHEFQHLIHNYQAKYKTGWIDEGMGDLAIKVNGYPIVGVQDIFARNPDTQLNTWGNVPQSSLAHYAASYLFFNYTAQRYGPEFIRDLIHAPREGIGGIQAVLDQRANGLAFDELFADWAVTNYLNDSAVENGRYAYANEPTFKISRIQSINQYPVTRNVSMKQYAASYYSLQPASGDITIYFTGTTTAKLLPVNAKGGQWMWYSNRADLSNMTLTRAFDLSRASKATLQFSTWFDIEKNYDFGYVEVSTDGGKTWDILKGKYTTTENPNGASYGNAYSGRSGSADERQPAEWVQEQIDLSAYAGKSILIRFDYITDDAYNTPGWAIDDITIPEINYTDNVESGDSGWLAVGFIRADNVLPQKYIVNVVQAGAATRVARLPIDAQNRGTLTINGFGKDITKVVLIVTAHAPTTTEPTEYQFSAVGK